MQRLGRLHHQLRRRFCPRCARQSASSFHPIISSFFVLVMAVTAAFLLTLGASIACGRRRSWWSLIVIIRFRFIVPDFSASVRPAAVTCSHSICAESSRGLSSPFLALAWSQPQLCLSHRIFVLLLRCLVRKEAMTPNKTLQATAYVLCGWAVDGSHDAVVAGASALPAAVPELGR